MASYLKFKSKAKAAARYFTNWDRNLLSMTHELSGPLTAAHLNLDKYMLNQDPDSLIRLMDNLILMEDYLSTARQHIKRIPETREVFSVNRQLAVIINNLSPLASDSGASLRLNDMPDCRLTGNPTRFKQIISCFIRNGIEAYDDCQHDHKTVTIEHYHEDKYLVIGIRDHGSGIAEEDKNNIFKPYFSTKSSSNGLGIGLSLAAESIAEEFGGHVKVDSDGTGGSTFRLYFLGLI